MSYFIEAVVVAVATLVLDRLFGNTLLSKIETKLSALKTELLAEIAALKGKL